MEDIREIYKLNYNEKCSKYPDISDKDILPEVLRPIMIDESIGSKEYYLESFKIDVVFGGKTMYSEAILPEIDDKYLINIIKKYEKNLNDEEKNRNIIRTKSYGN